MDPYQIPLRNEKLKLYNQIALLIIVIHLALFGYMAYTLPAGDTRSITLLSAVLLGILLALKKNPYFQKKENELLYHAIAEMLIVITWIVAGYWVFGLLTGFIGTLYVLACRPLNVIISKEQVQYPSFPPQKINWAALDSVMLKDGLLTIDFKNDRLVQQPTATDFSSRQEQEINEFCRQQLSACP